MMRVGVESGHGTPLYVPPPPEKEKDIHMADQTPNLPQARLTQTKTGLLRSIVLLAVAALLFTACSSDSESATPASIPFDDASELKPDDTSADTGDGTTNTASVADTVPEATPATTVKEEAPEAPEAPDPVTEPVVTFGTDENDRALYVKDVDRHDVLNVRSGPGASNEIIGALGSDAWYVRPTTKTATVDGVLWREVELVDGTIGFVHSNFVAFSESDCNETFVDDAVIGAHQTTGDLDGDGLSDAIELLISNDNVHVEVAFANGATMRNSIGQPSDQAIAGLGGYAVSAIDIDGNGRDELRIDVQEGRWTGTTFYRASQTCDLWAYGNTGSVFDLGTYGSAGSPMMWGCRNVGTSDVQIVRTVGSQEPDGMVFTITTYGFDIDDGFIGVADAPPFTQTPAEIDALPPIETCAI